MNWNTIEWIIGLCILVAMGAFALGQEYERQKQRGHGYQIYEFDSDEEL